MPSAGSAARQCHLPGEAAGTPPQPGPGAEHRSKTSAPASFPAASARHGAQPAASSLRLRAAPGTPSGRPGAGRARSARSLPRGGCNTWLCKAIFCFIPREQVFNSLKRERAKDARLGFRPVPTCALDVMWLVLEAFAGASWVGFCHFLDKHKLYQLIITIKNIVHCVAQK